MMKSRMIIQSVILMITLSSCIAQLPPSSSSQMKCECTCTQIGNPTNKYTAVGNFQGSIDPVVPSPQSNLMPTATGKTTVQTATEQLTTVKQEAPAGTGQTVTALEPNVEFIGGFNMLEVLMKEKKGDAKPQGQQKTRQQNNRTTMGTMTETTTEATTIREMTTETTTEMITTMATQLPKEMPTEPLPSEQPQQKSMQIHSQQLNQEPVQFKLNGNGGQISMKSVFSLNGKIPKPSPPKYKVKQENGNRNKTGGIISSGVSNINNSVISGVPLPPRPTPKVQHQHQPVSDFQSASLGGGGSIVSGGVLSGVVRSEFKDGFRHNGGVILETITKRQEIQPPNVNFNIIKSEQLSQSQSEINANHQHTGQQQVQAQAQNQMIQDNTVNKNSMNEIMQHNMMLQNMQQFQQEPLEPELPSNWQMMANTVPRNMQNPNSQMIPPSRSQMIPPNGPEANQQNMIPQNMQNVGRPNNQNFGTTEAPWPSNTQQTVGNWNMGTQQPQGNAQNWNQQGRNTNIPSTVSPPPTKSTWPVQQPKSQSNPGGQWGGGSNQSMQPRGNNVGQNNQNMQNAAGQIPPSATMSMLEQFGAGMEMPNPFNMGNMGMFPMGEMPNPFFFGAR